MPSVAPHAYTMPARLKLPAAPTAARTAARVQLLYDCAGLVGAGHTRRSPEEPSPAPTLAIPVYSLRPTPGAQLAAAQWAVAPRESDRRLPRPQLQFLSTLYAPPPVHNWRRRNGQWLLGSPTGASRAHNCNSCLLSTPHPRCTIGGGAMGSGSSGVRQAPPAPTIAIPVYSLRPTPGAQLAAAQWAVAPRESDRRLPRPQLQFLSTLYAPPPVHNWRRRNGQWLLGSPTGASRAHNCNSCLLSTPHPRCTIGGGAMGSGSSGVRQAPPAPTIAIPVYSLRPTPGAQLAAAQWAVAPRESDRRLPRPQLQFLSTLYAPPPVHNWRRRNGQWLLGSPTGASRAHNCNSCLLSTPHPRCTIGGGAMGSGSSGVRRVCPAPTIAIFAYSHPRRATGGGAMGSGSSGVRRVCPAPTIAIFAYSHPRRPTGGGAILRHHTPLRFTISTRRTLGRVRVKLGSDSTRL